MRAVKISMKTARALADALETLDRDEHFLREERELRAAMAPKKFVKLARVRKVAKKRTKREKLATVREAVEARAHGRCEAWGCTAGRMECDHFFGRARHESLETCWLLCANHHREKTLNRPDAATWLRIFETHATGHGYAAAARLAKNRLESLSLSQQAEAAR